MHLGPTGDRAIAAIAARQHGVVSRPQLLAIGISRSAINHRLRESRLHPLHRGVYLVGHPVPPPLAPEMAAVLACREGSAVSHHAAAAAQGFGPPCSGPIDVTVQTSSSPRRTGLRVHRTTRLEPDEVTLKGAVRVTSPARTILDLATELPLKDLRRRFENALVGRLIRVDELRALLDRAAGRPGSAAARALVDHDHHPALTRSEAEERLLELMRAAGLPPTGTNARIGRFQVDVLWLPQRLVVEIDGFAYHANRAAFERDRLRDAELQAGGYRVIRVTWRQIESSPEAVIARISQALAVGYAAELSRAGT